MVMLILSAISPVSIPALAARAPFPPDIRLYDDADIYSDEDEQTLNEALNAAHKYIDGMSALIPLRYAQNDTETPEVDLSLLLPDFDPNAYIIDYSNVLTGTQMDALTALYEIKSEELKVHFYFVIAPYPTSKSTSQFTLELRQAYIAQLPESHMILVVPGLPEARDVFPISFDYSGGLPMEKIGDNARSDIYSGVNWALFNRSDYQEAAEAFISISEKSLKSIFPKVVMSETLSFLFILGLLVGFFAAAVIILILRIAHNHGLTHKSSTSNYLVKDSLYLYYNGDKFVDTMTTRVILKQAI